MFTQEHRERFKKSQFSTHISECQTVNFVIISRSLKLIDLSFFSISKICLIGVNRLVTLVSNGATHPQSTAAENLHNQLGANGEFTSRQSFLSVIEFIALKLLIAHPNATFYFFSPLLIHRQLKLMLKEIYN